MSNPKKDSHWSDAIFNSRKILIAVFITLTLVMLGFAIKTRVDASFTKQLPLQHEYIQTFLKYQEKFGGANRIVIALTVEEGDIFTPEYFTLLKEATDEVFFVPGVDRARVTSIWTPNTRFVEIIEDGFAGGNVVPAEFSGTPEDLQTVKENIVKSGKLGLLVSEDFTGAIISAQLTEVNPQTGEKLDYVETAHYLEEKIREPFEARGESIKLKIHIIGFAKVIGDVSDGVVNVLLFFLISLILTVAFVKFYCQSWRLAMLPIGTSIVAVIWQLGILTILGLGIDPMSILVPFLVFAIGVSHGVQMVRSFRAEVFAGLNGFDAAQKSFRNLLVPGGAALLTDTIGFVTILLIKIPMIQELAIAASIGVAVILFTNLLFLPLMLSYLHLSENYKTLILSRREKSAAIWNWVAKIARPVPSLCVVFICLILGILGMQFAAKVKIGDQQSGVPELRQSSRYNQDSKTITSKFKIGADVISVIVETIDDGVIDYEVMELVDRFAWHMRNVPNVQSVLDLPGLAKLSNAGWSEGYPKWQILPQHPAIIAQSISLFDTTTGLFNETGSVIPVRIYLTDHKAETIQRVLQEVKDFREQNPSDKVNFKLASGNVGVMGAKNEVVAKAQFPIIMYVFGAIILLCLITFRSWKAAVCIVLPLALVSTLAYSLMYFLGIGLKSNTLPVVALGVGVGVDYGIYLFSRLDVFLKKGELFEESLQISLSRTGSAVVFTGITLGLGVATWIFSSLKFQADMGILLTFMFLLNMLGAILLLPAIARWLYPHHHVKTD